MLRYTRTSSARCGLGAQPIHLPSSPSSLSACEERCSRTDGCSAAHFRNGSCQLYGACLTQVADLNPVKSVLLHRLHIWPSEPQRVQWRADVALVIASFASDLAWLRRLPADLADVVIYRKENALNGTATGDGVAEHGAAPITHAHILQLLSHFELCMSNASGTLDAGLTTLRSMSRPGSARRQWAAGACAPGCACGCVCGPRTAPSQRPRLAYFARTPNFGEVTGPLERRGGSREPSSYLQFLLDFRRNLPRMVIFTQDDCGKRFLFLCRWGQNLHATRAAIAAALAGQPPRPPPQQTSALARGVASSRPRRPSLSSCLCEYVRENVSFGRVLGPLLGFAADARADVGWPKHANFAVRRDSILAQPTSLYRSLHRLVTVEGQCASAPATFDWAHDYERMWLALFDERPKAPQPAVRRCDVLL